MESTLTQPEENVLLVTRGDKTIRLTGESVALYHQDPEPIDMMLAMMNGEEVGYYNIEEFERIGTRIGLNFQLNSADANFTGDSSLGGAAIGFQLRLGSNHSYERTEYAIGEEDVRALMDEYNTLKQERSDRVVDRELDRSVVSGDVNLANILNLPQDVYEDIINAVEDGVEISSIEEARAELGELLPNISEILNLEKGPPSKESWEL